MRFRGNNRHALPPGNSRPPPSSIDQFWEPFISSADPTTFCLGEPAKNIDMDSINSFDAPVSPPNSHSNFMYASISLGTLRSLM